jgi:alpha-galactosidase
MNSLQLSWLLKSGESFTSPECAAVFSSTGLGDMSRKFHRLYRNHLIKSKFVYEPRPVLLNSWEGLYFDFDEDRLEKLAKAAAALSVKLFILDDGWFGVKHPRVIDDAGLGDWKANPDRFPNGLSSLVKKVRDMDVAGSSEKLQFGLWIEPEMVNPKSELYENHPDWVLNAPGYDRSESRNQLVLNLGLKDVQDYIIKSISEIVNDKEAPITYIKWDNNRAMHEVPTPSAYHGYILGAYRVYDTLTTRFPDVLWEGCAGGGGRFDPGTLQYFPQIWTSDNMDPLSRLKIQFGTSMVYPPSTMGSHVGASPNHVTKRIQTFKFRAHVALMGGSFGFELDPDKLTDQEREQMPALVALAEQISPIVIKGDFYRLVLPEDSQDPAALVLSEDGSQGVLFAFHLFSTVAHEMPFIKLQGLDATARYRLDGETVVSGATLMNGGIKFPFDCEYDSKVVLIERV